MGVRGYFDRLKTESGEMFLLLPKPFFSSGVICCG